MFNQYDVESCKYEKKVHSFHLCSLLCLYSLFLKSSRSMWDCCLLKHPSIRLSASPPTRHFDCPTCWKREPERNRGQREKDKYSMWVWKGLLKATCLMQNNINISTLHFITSKTDKHRVKAIIEEPSNTRDIKETFWAKTISFHLKELWLRLI